MSFDDPDALPNVDSRKMPIITSFPTPIVNSSLTATEQRVYLQLSLEFSLILEDAPSFQMGAYQWNLILADRLQTFALTGETWERLSSLGDEDEELQKQLNELIEQFS
ncbi:MAG: hypothetical protein ACW99F_05430 [Candidatus Hodarchaeales archaeon]